MDSALHDDDDETLKAASDDGHSYAGTVARGVSSSYCCVTWPISGNLRAGDDEIVYSYGSSDVNKT